LKNPKMIRVMQAFTLIELLIVVAIIGILVSLAFPVISSVRESSRIASARADMRSIEHAVDQYYALYRKLPVPDYAQGTDYDGDLIIDGTMDLDGGGWHHKDDTFSPRKAVHLLSAYRILQGVNENGMNPRENQFLELQEGRPAGHYMDPWSKGFTLQDDPGNRPYGMLLNVAYDKKILFWPAARTSSIPSNLAHVTNRWVLVRCYGPNRKEDYSMDRDDYDDIYSIDTSYWEELAK